MEGRYRRAVSIHHIIELTGTGVIPTIRSEGNIIRTGIEQSATLCTCPHTTLLVKGYHIDIRFQHLTTQQLQFVVEMLRSRLRAIGHIAVRRGNIKQRVSLGDIVQVVFRLIDGDKFTPIHIKTQQDRCLFTIADLIDIVTVAIEHGRTLVSLLQTLVIGIHLELGLTSLKIFCLHQTILIEQQQEAVTIGLQILKVLVGTDTIGLLRSHREDIIAIEQPHHTIIANKHIVNGLLETEIKKFVFDRRHKLLRCQIHTSHRLSVLQPQVVILIEIKMVVATIFI